ncbi:GatB/YqeY domain-containing protein [Pokkaliibacter sp. MBI-7]|uniref:GatB/YqeY domain-containing protein n=1 Tax=Pokkaliibacter sp. MBI-7 TaxID=3040600 RepID=UPI00244B2FD2|nr:GatB/YqeY domain-containing protein [Pokkaliibacter sp. MBI-7]MDH2434266.1 GatB/YqeY domain-containing protein [Pokkaliibacter sp. MBI-7]
MSDTGLKHSITEAMKAAMRARDQKRLGTIRLMLADIKRIEVDERIELDDARILAVLDKMQKQRRDSIEQFAQAGRQDLVDIETAEMEVIQTFLPAPFTDEELEILIEQAITESGAASAKDMGKVMGLLKQRAQGRADMTAINKKVKARLG